MFEELINPLSIGRRELRGSIQIELRGSSEPRSSREPPEISRLCGSALFLVSSPPARRCPRHSSPLPLPPFSPANYTARLFMDTSDTSKLSKSLREL
jgi:hypothetical protein